METKSIKSEQSAEKKHLDLLAADTDFEMRSLDAVCVNESALNHPWWYNFKYALVGVLFGIVFVKAEIISWFRIQEMFKLQSFHMYGVIGSAVVVGVISVFLIRKFKIKTIYGEPIVFVTKKFNKGQVYGGLLFGLRLGNNRCMPGTIICPDRHRCYSNIYYFAERYCRHFDLWKVQREVAALKLYLFMFHNRTFLVLSAAVLFIAVSQFSCSETDANKTTVDSSVYKSIWVGASAGEIPYYSSKDGKLIWYGHELIANTSTYLGPKGTVMQISNGMNCQNCHLSAGTKPWGNNYSAVFSTYPKFRDRSGSIETIYKRVNDCIERSLNGKALDTSSKEMHAIYAYIKWLGEEVPKGLKPKGSGIEDLPYLERAANPLKGKTVFAQTCQRCHGADGQGVMNKDGMSYQYPPLWGKHSYNTGAGLFRLSRFAGYVKNNMPFEADYHSPQLSNEEAWDVAAFVNSQPRPAMNLSKDWPDISKKPIDHPFGPYADSFSEQQHKFGPFGPIKEYREKNKH